MLQAQRVTVSLMLAQRVTVSLMLAQRVTVPFMLAQRVAVPFMRAQRVQQLADDALVAALQTVVRAVTAHVLQTLGQPQLQVM